MIVKHVEGVTYDELAEIELSDGEVRRCKVLEVNGDHAVVQLFESAPGINLADSKVRFLGHPLQLGVSRTCSAASSTAWASPSTAARRSSPRAPRHQRPADEPRGPRLPGNEFIQTGVSTIDGLNTLVRGQKLPIFSGSGLPHAALAAQIARQAKVLDDNEQLRCRLCRHRHHVRGV